MSNDMTFCTPHLCTYKETCQRAKIPQVPDWQPLAFFMFEPFIQEINKCEFYIRSEDK